MSAPVAGAPPRRGTRPKNRRALIVDAAADLFYERGYAGVSMNDVAGAVNVRASSLYRHFSGKQELLRAVIAAELEPFGAVVSEAATLQDAIPGLAAAAAGRPRLGVLWQRESRALEGDEVAPLAREVHRVTAGLTALLTAQRPGLTAGDASLLAWCAVSVLRSVPKGGARPGRADHEDLLSQTLTRLLALPVRRAPQPAPAPWDATTTYAPQSTREPLLAIAVPLMAASGYAGTSLEEIAARAGMAGPSIYPYFDSKQDLLFAALGRAADAVLLDLYRSLGRAQGPEDALRRLTTCYLTLAGTHSALIDLLITDVHHLDDPQRSYVLHTQESVRAEWAHVLAVARPGLRPVMARAVVRAAQAIADDLARSPGLRRMPGAFATVVDLLLEVQAAPAPAGAGA
ncbi:TetR family transcriptional regulator [Baekduia soli]|uniref:TetR family transcriptional regulator n=1 Tax=Baekduia soli TaxID=496014 RepID=A0A5B8U0C5_9ACTN|nr:TetR family transcriptional regulator [Baekduia soli]QEC46469.1 TetR family transcriptional regulator [Baekduia soli]